MSTYPIYSNPHDAEVWADATEGAGANSPVGYEAENLSRASVMREFRTGETWGTGSTTEVVIKWAAQSKPSTPLRALLVQHTNALQARLEYAPTGGGGWQAEPDENVVSDLWGYGRALLTPAAPVMVDDVRVVLTVDYTDTGLATLDGAPFWRIGALHWFKNADDCDWGPSSMQFNLMESELVSEYANGRRTSAIMGPAQMRLDLQFEIATAFGDPGPIIRLARRSPVICVDWPAPAWGVLPLMLDDREASVDVRAADLEGASWVLREVVHDLEGYGDMTDQPIP